MGSSNKFRIFACDGGGFRGYLSSLILERVETELRNIGSTNPTRSNLYLGDYFDMYAGTSTGALIACGLASGKSAKEIKELYEVSGKLIFPDLSIRKEIRYRAAQFFSIFTPKRLEGITSQHRFWFSRPLFDGTELKKALQTTFGNSCLGDLSTSNKRILITAYDCWNSLPVVFDSYNEQHRALRVVDLLLASSAYPGGFPSRFIRGEAVHDSNTEPGHSLPPEDVNLPLVDGSLVSNNPSLIALSKYYEKCKSDRQPYQSVVVGSFGTGKLLLRFSYQDTMQMGQLDWTFPFGDPLMESISGGHSRIMDRVAALLVRELATTEDDADNYFRFQPYVLSMTGQQKVLSPDSVLINSKQQKKYELATFQYQSKDILQEIAGLYLQDKPIEQALNPSRNLNLQISQRINKLVNCLF